MTREGPYMIFGGKGKLVALTFHRFYVLKAKEKFRGMFEIQKSGDKTSSGEIGLDI